MVCLETTFIIDVLRGENSVIPLEEKISKSEEIVTVASPTIMEIIAGALQSSRPEEEKQKVINCISTLKTLDFGSTEAHVAGQILANLIKKGEMIEITDVMIGAVAKENNQTLLTKNVKHFSKIKDLKIETY